MFCLVAAVIRSSLKHEKRGPRIKQFQRKELVKLYETNHYVTKEEAGKIAGMLNLSVPTVFNWFSNRRVSTKNFSDRHERTENKGSQTQ